jgi:hypothetical protein
MVCVKEFRIWGFFFLTGRRNRGELAEGWYEPATLEKARQNAAEQRIMDRERASPDYARGGQAQSEDVLDPPPAEDDEDDDDYGPKMPHPGSHRATARSGPAIPNMQDLELRRGKHPVDRSIDFE